jgi:hypothetical protein
LDQLDLFHTSSRQDGHPQAGQRTRHIPSPFIPLGRHRIPATEGRQT